MRISRSERHLELLAYTHVHLCLGDGYGGWPEPAPFGAMIVTCAPEKVPPPLTAGPKDAGRMIIPVRPLSAQELVLVRKRGDKPERHGVLLVRFVPMTGEPEARGTVN